MDLYTYFITNSHALFLCKLLHFTFHTFSLLFSIHANQSHVAHIYTYHLTTIRATLTSHCAAYLQRLLVAFIGALHKLPAQTQLSGTRCVIKQSLMAFIFMLSSKSLDELQDVVAVEAADADAAPVILSPRALAPPLLLLLLLLAFSSRPIPLNDADVCEVSNIVGNALR